MCSPSAPKASHPTESACHPQTFPKHRRLRKRAEFQQVYELGARLPGRLLTVFVRLTEPSCPSRIGLTVSRAIGSAVVRNRVKRRLREAARLNWPLLPDGREVVLHARQGIGQAGWAEIVAEVQRAFRFSENPKHHPGRKRARQRGGRRR